jgi:hypothetical protein
MLRKSASGPEVELPGRIWAGFQSGKLQNQPSGRPRAEIQPGRQISGPEALLRNIGQHLHARSLITQVVVTATAK